MNKFLVFLTRLGKGEVKVGLRSFWDGRTISFLNTPLSFTKPKDFLGTRSLHELAQKLGRPIKIYSWVRDEYGTSDGAHYGTTGIVIRPEMDEAELIEITRQMGEAVGQFVITNLKGGLDPVDPIKL